MQRVNDFLTYLDSHIGGAQWFVYVLLGTGLFFTLYLKFPQIRFFGRAIKIVSGKFDRKGDEGDTSHFQALTTALSGTVGTGNIAGVALALHLGGPAALFWMLVTAFLGMTTKFVEVTLSHKYREHASDGSIAGGPMYYMKNKLKMRWLAVIFALATVLSSFGTGNLPQINSISNSIFTTFGISHIITGAVLAVLLAFVIIGGIKRIASVTARLVPGMALIYVLGSLAVLAFNYENIIPSFLSIFTDVFSGTAATGGFLGASVMYAFNRGVNRGLFSNEAGQGSAPIAHAAARAHEPVSEGMVAILEPFIDTILICTLTGLVILSSGVWTEKYTNDFHQADMYILEGTYSEEDIDDQQIIISTIEGERNDALYSGKVTIENGIIQENITVVNSRSLAEDVKIYREGELYNGILEVEKGNLSQLPAELKVTGKSLLHSAPLTAEAFTSSYLGKYGQYIVSIGLLLFAFSTAISWSYYGDRAINYLFGAKYVLPYHIIYVIAFFFASFTDTTIIWIFSGITIAFMTLPNLFGILWLHKDMKATLGEYLSSIKKEEKQ